MAINLAPCAPLAAHRAQFYDDLGFLALRVAEFFAAALDAGGAAVVVARPAHRDALVAHVASFGLDVAKLRAAGRMLEVDADELLARFMVDGAPDATRFRTVIGALIDQARGAGTGTVHVYGEMVDILWAAQRAEAMIRLEDLWNELASEQPFSLLCGYRLGAFADERHVHMFHEVCGRHELVSPTERLAGLSTDPEMNRTISELEQRARALESEVQRRGQIERRLEELLAAAEAGRTKNELLYQLTATCNQIEDLESVYQLALETVERGTRSDRAAVLLFDPDDVLRFKACHGLSDRYRQAVEGHSPWSRETTDPQPIVVDDTEADPAWAPYRERLRAEGIRSLAFIPLVNQRELLGKFMLYRDEPVPFTARQVQFAQLVAVQVAQAIERARRSEELARSLREMRAAHQEAEEATRAREEILSVVSHDLRNPLGSILMGASSLLQVADPGDKKSQRVHGIAQRIHRQAERMARLIEDLVDFAGIQAGKIAIERARHAPAEIIGQASELFGPIAEERGLVLEAFPAPGLPAIDCDSERALQVLANLVTNALKVTPRGGSVAIGAQPMADEIVFYVRDTGPGIDPEDLPRLFERYWRSKQASYKGAGLGLSIARGIVEAHGGRIWAESQVGTGSTFFFSLQPTRSN